MKYLVFGSQATFERWSWATVLLSTKVSGILVLSQKHFIKTWICGSKGFWRKCPSLPEKMLIPSCLDQISGFSPSGISPPRRKNFCLHFLNRNHLYLNSGSLTFSPLTFVSRQTLYKHNCAFCTASQRLISSLAFFAFKTCFFSDEEQGSKRHGQDWTQDHCKSCGNARFWPNWRLK